MIKVSDVVIIGGGIIGISIAYHLAKSGCSNVVVLEKEDLIGAGSTSKGAGGIRQQFSTEINIRLSMESVKIFERFADEMGCEEVFYQNGYLFLLSTEEEMKSFKKNVELQRDLGLEVDILSPDEMRAMIPFINTEDILGVTFCRSDGYADIDGVLQGFAREAKRLGVKIYLKTEVEGIEVENGRVCKVRTRRGDIETHTVINAGGPYSAIIGKMVGIDLPITPFKRQIFVTEPLDFIPDSMPMIIDFHTKFYCRKESGGLLMGGGEKKESSGFDTNVDWGVLESLVEKGIHRIPGIKDARIKKGWAGLYSITLDFNPILGKVPHVEGFVCAVGFSGHGFMHSPIVGKLISELIIDGEASTIDISPLSINRFEDKDRIIPEENVI
ncbi:MAG: FAD-binding oxidoreductase [Nitrospinae bacterium]|nr:FAD-binding oxidoreductase [Nitrospinota bacterium]